MCKKDFLSEGQSPAQAWALSLSLQYGSLEVTGTLKGLYVLPFTTLLSILVHYTVYSSGIVIYTVPTLAW